MYLLARLFLLIVHTIYGLKNLIFSLIPGRSPKPFLTRRRKLPTHISLILVLNENHNASEEKEVMKQCIGNTVTWCKKLGISRLSIYERDGNLNDVILSVANDTHDTPSASKMSGRLTPPLSDVDPSELAPLENTIRTMKIPYLSNHTNYTKEMTVGDKPLKRKKHSQGDPQKQILTLQLLSREASKPALAEVVKRLIQTHSEDALEDKFTLTMENLNTILEVDSGFTPPDLLIVYPLYPSTAPLEIHGYPPWHTRLSEIHYNPRHGGILRGLLGLLSRKRRRLNNPPHPITEVDFGRALDEYSDAEFRLGK